MKRSAGILLPIFSLPSEYGIGSLGAEARAFVDFLRDAGQKWWQILPIGPTGAGNSPYTSESTFAGSPLLIDLEHLAAEGLLDRSDLEGARVPPSDRIDYGELYRLREPLLRKAFQAGYPRDRAAVEAFCRENKWLDNYALYMALKARFGMKSWLDWPNPAHGD